MTITYCLASHNTLRNIMNQAYFTFCCTGPGKSVSGLGGDRARAAVKGATDAELNAYRQFCGYPQYSTFSLAYFPQQVASASNPFAKLIFNKLGNNGAYFLAHSVYAAPDNETNREGNYFIHLIYPLPQSWSVRTALEMWGSPFWQTHDSDDISPELPELKDEDVPFGIINQNSFTEFLRASEKNQKKFHFLLKSLLASNSQNKIVLTGAPEEMAFCLWGATKFLPPNLWQNITFSTHERPNVNFPFTVVNFPLVAKPGSQEELALHQLSNWPNVFFYSENPEIPSSPVPEFTFADDVVKICLDEAFEPLNKFYKEVPPENRKTGTALELCWKFICHEDDISSNDVQRALQMPLLKSRAIDMLMDNSRFTLDQQLEFYQRLDPARQDVLLNRMIADNSIEQLRNNPDYAQLLISALTINPPQEAPEKELSMLQKIKKALFD